jgi:hypothetical protein
MIAAVIAKKRKYIRTFKNAGALSFQTAINPEDHHISTGPIFNKLVREGIIVAADSERYYLDEVAEENVTTKRRKIVVFILFVVLLALAIVMGVLK